MRWISNSTKALLRKVATSILPALLGVVAIYLILSNGLTRRAIEPSKGSTDIHAAPVTKDAQDASVSENDRASGTSESGSQDKHEDPQPANFANNSSPAQTPALFPLRVSPPHLRPKRSQPIATFSPPSNRLQRPGNRRRRPSNRLSQVSNRRMMAIKRRGIPQRPTAKASRENGWRRNAIELDWRKCTRSTAFRATLTKRARRSTKAKSKNIVAQSMPLERRRVILKGRCTSINRGKIDA